MRSSWADPGAEIVAGNLGILFPTHGFCIVHLVEEYGAIQNPWLTVDAWNPAIAVFGDLS